MLESKTINCDPEDESAVLDTYQAFLWKLVNRQVIFNKEEKFDGAASITNQYGNTGGTIYTHEEVTNYVSLLFQRDTSDPLYSQVAELERKWEQAGRDIEHSYAVVKARSGQKSRKEGGVAILGVFAFILLTGGILMISIGNSENKPSSLLVTLGVIAIIFAVFVAVFVVIKGMTASKIAGEPNESEKQQIDKYQSERIDCINEAKRLITENEKAAKK